MYKQFLAICLLYTLCHCYEEEDLRNALGGDLSQGLDDLMTSFGQAIDGLAELAEGKTIECAYKCPNGKKPKANPNHKPTTNGCGSFGIEFDTGNLPQMTSCCDTHDICYDTCDSDKEKCDKEFKQCLLKMCDNMIEELDNKEYEGCQATTEIMYRGTLALGCTPYKNAQKNACECGVSIEHKPDHNKQNKPKDQNKQKQSKETKPGEKKEKRTSRKSGEL